MGENASNFQIRVKQVELSNAAMNAKVLQDASIPRKGVYLEEEKQEEVQD